MIYEILERDKNNQEFKKLVTTKYSWSLEKYKDYFIDIGFALTTYIEDFDEIEGIVVKYNWVISPEVSIFIINIDDSMIWSLKEQPKSFALAAIRKDPMNIFEIKTPLDEELCIECLKQEWMLIKLMQDDWRFVITNTMEMAAIRNNGLAIKYIKNPSEKLCMAAIEQNVGAILLMKSYSKRVAARAKELAILSELKQKIDDYFEEELSN